MAPTTGMEWTKFSMKQRLPEVPLDYWTAFVAVAEEGSVNAAAERLGKGNSTISYALKQLQLALGAELLQPAGRGIALTDAGKALKRRVEQLVRDAAATEQLARHYAAGWEAELKLAVDAVFPQDTLMLALERFGRVCSQTRLQLLETTLSGTDEALFSGQVDLAMSYRVPPGFVGERLLDMRFVAVAAPHHPLAAATSLTLDDLRQHRQFVVRDSGTKRNQDAGWLGADQRWTVSHFEASRALIRRGLGFGWLPLDRIREELQSGQLKALPLQQGQVRGFPLHLIIARHGEEGPAQQTLIEALRLSAKESRLQQWPLARWGISDEPG